MDANNPADLPQFKSIKTVRAIKIKSIVGPWETQGSGSVSFEDSSYPDLTGVEPHAFARYRARPGDYFITAADGSRSFMSAAAFEAEFVAV